MIKKDFSNEELFLISGLLLPSASVLIIITAAILQYIGVTIFGATDVFAKSGTVILVLSIFVTYKKSQHKDEFSVILTNKAKSTMRGIIASRNIRDETGKRKYTKEDREIIDELVETISDTLNKTCHQALETNLYLFEYRTAVSGAIVSATQGINANTFVSIAFVAIVSTYILLTYANIYKLATTAIENLSTELDQISTKRDQSTALPPSNQTSPPKAL
ncbi:hypothetical protein HUF18_14390 [Thalassolituus sp. ST750PaO-4]|uniref:hypothetical protein n=1 Tax=Thalassolituus sp. ST750PaO-4 TaxID=2742965 RepID=UPI000C374263|nr:hypothetical protein [Thalassolituus sp. ST750PaO-4]MCA6060967.1 hypothetical protein [Thalassolituus sp. ST750PaO-4]PIQ38977.1 MAG: hypothetical protein COW58_14325 [Thalassolituus sp. CG17_big_fil_post_rev_8_21_14_2_50_53_8]